MAPADQPDQPDQPDLPFRSCYDLLGFRAEVASPSAELIAALDRLNAEFRVANGEKPAARYVAVPQEVVLPGTDGRTVSGQFWEVTYQDLSLGYYETVPAAAGYVEWHLCGEAIDTRHDLLHVHGAAVAGPQASVLLPGASGIGKTTLALALALRGLRLLSDDVVFLRPADWRPEAFPRSFHIHDDALPRLIPLGLRYRPEEHIDGHLCATVLAPWDRTPGPPLRYVIFPRLEPDATLSLEPLSGAESTLELMRYSKNLRHMPRHGLDVIPDLLEQVECYVLHRTDDLAAATDLVRHLVETG